MGKNIKNKKNYDRIYVNNNFDNGFEIIFRSQNFRGYEYFCITAYEREGRFFIDDHLAENINIKKSGGHCFLYLELKYSKDFEDFNIERSEITIRIHEDNNELILEVDEPEILIDSEYYM